MMSDRHARIDYGCTQPEAALAELFLLSNDAKMDRHVVFVHGLRRLGQKVWMSSGKPPELWPLWLASDIANLGIWSVEYDSAPTIWRGHSMARADRANNVLARLLAEERLRNGDVAFVVHSFGGLVLEHLLRLASERAPSEAHVAEFLQRISRITFLGTPHSGADLATWGGRLNLFFRLSDAAKGLERNDPDLRDLNQFFRTFATRNAIDTQSLTETRRVRWFGMVVKPDSADVGLPSVPIPIDADHFGIAAPASRTSEVYIHVRDQLKKQIRGPALPTDISQKLAGIAKHSSENAAALGRIERRLSDYPFLDGLSKSVPSELVDEETRKRVLRIRRMRFFFGSTHLEEASQLARDLRAGPLSATSHQEKARALAWCARILLAKPDRSEALSILECAQGLHRIEEVIIAEAFASSYEGDSSSALNILSRLDSDESRAASFIVVANDNARTDALAWFKQAGLTAANISSDGKFFLIKKHFDEAKWSAAVECANELQESDFDKTPALQYLAASAYMILAVPDELRSSILWNLPFDLALFPLADDSASLTARRKARELYNRVSVAAETLGCLRASNEASDRALWLGLRDPLSKNEARTELEMSMRNSAVALRRLPLALAFGLKLDLNAVEREIDRQDALTDGNSADVALARFSMGQTKSSPQDVVDYISKHRQQILKHLNPSFVLSVEVQLLAQSGQFERAEQRIQDLPAGPEGEHERQHLNRIVAEARGANPIEAREVQFKSTGALIDLVNLVQRLEEKKDWPRLVIYGYEYFKRTRGLIECRILAQALFETGDFNGVVELLDQHIELVQQSSYLAAIRAWSHFRLGDVRASRAALSTLRSRRDEANDRDLLVRLSIASGDWTSLGAFIEEEWERRTDRASAELLRAGQLAQQLGSARARELILEAASKANNDPEILAGCYWAAVKGGWEDGRVSAWIERAAELSGKDGPVRRMSMREMFDLHPEWQQRETKTWTQLQAGEIPIFVAASLLNRTLCELYLIPAISNAEMTDPRKRVSIYAYSGAREFFTGTAKTAGFDPTALLTLGVLGAIKDVFDRFERIFVPHSTLIWLFEERQRIQQLQPGRIVHAREIKRLLDLRLLQKFEPTAQINSPLAAEIGDDLAALFSEAASDFGDDKRQRLVVRSAPLHRIGSLMEEQADLKEHARYVCSCSDLVIALARRGQLTQAEEQRALAYLKLREQPWPQETVVEDAAVLYLDDLSLSYLRHLGLLAKLHSAGFIGNVPPGTLSQDENFVRHEELSARATAIIEQIRAALADAITAGKVVLAPSSRNPPGSAGQLLDHPTFDIFEVARLADVVVIDDRHFNQHGHTAGELGSKPVWTTHDVLMFASTEPAHRQEYLTGLRRFGLCFVPLKVEELISLIEQAEVSSNRLVESAELKAIRESLQLSRMSNALQLPKEHVWLDNITRAFLGSMRAQWLDDVEEEISRAKANWLFEQFDVRLWAHRLDTEQHPTIVEERHLSQILALAMLNTEVSLVTREKYWRWFDEVILQPVRERRQDLHEKIIARVRALIGEASLRGLNRGSNE